MLEMQIWKRCVDEFIEKLLGEANISSPPIDVMKLTDRLGIRVVLDKAQGIRGFHKIVRHKPLIVVRPESRVERLNWAVAHELGEVYGYQIYRRLNSNPTRDPSVPNREEMANRIAKCLLLPWKHFQREAQNSDCDLFELKDLFSTASHEMIATRLLDLDSLRYVSIFDHGAMRRRWTNEANRVTRLHPAEKQCWEETHEMGNPVEKISGGLRIRCWPIHEMDWKREILQTTPLGDD